MKQRILIISAGGHALVVADILRQAQAGQEVYPVGYLDDDRNLWGEYLLSLPVLGKLADLSRVPHEGIVVAIVDNAARRRVCERLAEQGEKLVAACHPTAIVGSGVQIGAGTMICAGAIANPAASIGDNVILNTGCSVDHHDQIGDYVHIAPGAHLGENVIVGQGALIGIGATVLPGLRIGAGATVGAGAVVTQDVPPGVTAEGNPARVLDPPGTEQI